MNTPTDTAALRERHQSASNWLAVGVLAVAAGVSGCNFVRGYAEGSSQEMQALAPQTSSQQELGIARFVFDDFGGLNTDTLRTNALPWKLMTTALVMMRHKDRDPTPNDVREALVEFGFLYPQEIANWPLARQPIFERPLGLVNGMIVRSLPTIRIDTVNTGCAACHAGVMYTKDGQPTNRVWIGMPNTSLDVDAFVDAVYLALKEASADRERLLATMQRLYPETSEQELQTIRRFIWGQIKSRLTELQSTGDRALSFKNGGPGITNGVAALKLRLGVADPHGGYAGTVSIPNLSARALRTSLLSDGVYARPGESRFAERSPSTQDPIALAPIVGFFTVPTMGMEPAHALQALPQVAQTMQFIANYESPQFPGAIDARRASRGSATYAAHCAQCHGTYDAGTARPKLLSYPNRLVAQAEMGTDPTRWQVIEPELLAAIERSAFAKLIAVQNTGGYVAPILNGVWATAPYLHNGSVPTLWHLLHPDARPQQFMVGGHALDFTLVGIAGSLDDNGVWSYPKNYRPWSKPQLFATTAPGRSNRGHEVVFASLKEEQKGDLLEFLKSL